MNRLQTIPSLLWRTWHRTANRWYDLLAHLTGYCNHRPWSPIPGEGGGYTHWRCARRRNHTGVHRAGSYIWNRQGHTAYAPTRSLPTQPWTRYMTPTIRDSRVQAQWQEDQRRRRLAAARSRHPSSQPPYVNDDHRRWADLAGYGGTAPPDPTHGQIDRDIQAKVDDWGPESLAQRVAVENTLQEERNQRRRWEILAEPDDD